MDVCVEQGPLQHHLHSHCLLFCCLGPNCIQSSVHLGHRLLLKEILDWYSIHVFYDFEIQIHLLGIFLNSLNSVLSFNNLNLNSILGKKVNDKHLHETSFLKQTLYFILFFCFQLGYDEFIILDNCMMLRSRKAKNARKSLN